MRQECKSHKLNFIVSFKKNLQNKNVCKYWLCKNVIYFDEKQWKIIIPNLTGVFIVRVETVVLMS